MLYYYIKDFKGVMDMKKISSKFKLNIICPTLRVEFIEYCNN